MTSKSKIIRTIYLYAAALVSLIFVAVGSGRILNTALKYYVFPKAEKGGFNQCNEQPPVYGLSDIKKSSLTEEQKTQIELLLKDYETWKAKNGGEECYSAQRQNNVVDALTMLIIALPLCLLHWKMIKKEKEENIG